MFVHAPEASMRGIVAGFSDSLKPLVNPDIIEMRKYESMESYIDGFLKELVKTFKQGEVKYLGYHPVDRHQIASIAGKSGKGSELVVFTNDTYVRTYSFNFELNYEGEVRKTNFKINIPIVCDDGVSYLIKGNKYCIPFQLVDSVFYNKSGSKSKTSDEICLKTELNNIKMRRIKVVIKDVDNNLYSTNEFQIDLNRTVTKIPMMLFYFANFGFYRTLDYFVLSNKKKGYAGVQLFTELPPEDSAWRREYIFFKYGMLYLSVKKDAFNSYIVKEQIACILATRKKNITAETIREARYWTGTLGAIIYNTNTYNGGINLLNTFRSTLGSRTKWLLKEFTGLKNVSDTYQIVRWMWIHYATLVKQESSIMNKRLRLTEFVIWPLQQRLLSKSRSYINKRKSYKSIKNLVDIFKINADIITSAIIGRANRGSSLNIGRYSNSVNDLSLNNYMLKATSVGPGSSTSMRTKFVPEDAKRIQDSMLKVIDIVTCSSNKPGATFSLLPNCHINRKNLGFK